MAVGSPTFNPGLAAVFPTDVCMALQEELHLEKDVVLHAVWKTGPKLERVAASEFRELNLNPHRGVLILLSWRKKEVAVALGNERSLAASAMDEACVMFRSGKPIEGVRAILDALEDSPHEG
jgi:hypothetical protein